MPVTNVSLETNKTQAAAVQPKSRYEYLSYDMKAWNNLQGVSPSRPILATALKIALAVPAFIVDVARNVAKLIGNAALSVANVGIGAFNMAQKALYGRVQQAPAKLPEAPFAVEVKTISPEVAPVAISESQVVTSSDSDDVFVGRVNVELCDDNCTTSDIEGEVEIVEEAQIEQATTSGWQTAGKVAAAAVVGTGLVVGGIYGYQYMYGFSEATKHNYLRPVRDFAVNSVNTVLAAPGKLGQGLVNGVTSTKDGIYNVFAYAGNGVSNAFSSVTSYFTASAPNNTTGG